MRPILEVLNSAAVTNVRFSMRRLKPFFVLVAFAAALTVLSSVPAGAQSQDEVERTQAEVDAAVQRLEAVAAELNEAVTAYQKVNGELADLNWRVATLFERIHEYEQEVISLRDQARDLVLEAYTSGGQDLIQVALEAGSIQDVLTSQELISRATDRDLIALDRLAAVRREMDRLKVELEADQERVAVLEAEAAVLVDQVEALYEAADAEYHEARDANRAAVLKFEEEQRRLRLLEQARKQGAAAGISAAATPGFVCPVPGASFINDWGFPRSGGRTHKGTDVFAPFGTPIRAVAAGTVRLSNSSLGGITVWLNATDGNSYYFAHLQSYASGMATGATVAAGQTIGFVGDSGNARGGAPHLHFQVHPGGGGPVNPYPTLAARC